MGDMIRYKRIYYDVISAYIIRYINEKRREVKLLSILVPRPGIEPGWIAPLVFETSASTDSAIWANTTLLICGAKVLIIFELTNFLVTFFSKNAFLMQKH